METICKIEFFVREVDDGSSSDDSSEWMDESADVPELSLEFIYHGELDLLRETSWCLWDFTKNFSRWFESKKHDILQGISSVVAIERPAFYVTNNRLIGVCLCSPEDVYVELKLTWNKAKYNFREWFDYCDFDLHDDFNEIQAIYDAIRNKCGDGEIIVSANKDGTISLTVPEKDVPTLIMSHEEQGEFLKFLDSLYELTIDGEASFRHNMAKND